MVKRRLGACLLTAGMILLYFAALLAILHAVGTDASLYHRLQLRAGVLDYAGVSDDELRALDDALASYLAGDASALASTPFNERELSHMADCYDLFVLLRRVLLLTLPAALLLTVLALLACGCRSLSRAALRGALIFLGTILLLGIWGLVDFDSLFTAFHRLLFSNDLWLLDPRTDLLIRICPQSMFSTMALWIGGLELGFLLLWNLLCRLLTRLFRRKR